MRSTVLLLLLALAVPAILAERSRARRASLTAGMTAEAKAQAMVEAEMEMLVTQKAMLMAQRASLIAQMKVSNCSGVTMAGIVSKVSSGVAGGWVLPGVDGVSEDEKGMGFRADPEEDPEGGLDNNPSYVGADGKADADTSGTVDKGYSATLSDDDAPVSGEATEGAHSDVAFFMDGDRKKYIGSEAPKDVNNGPQKRQKPKRSHLIDHSVKHNKGASRADELMQQAKLLEQQAQQMRAGQHHPEHKKHRKHRQHLPQERVVSKDHMDLLGLLD